MLRTPHGVETIEAADLYFGFADRARRAESAMKG